MRKSSSSVAVQPDALMESMLFEDGVAAAVEKGVPGVDPVSVQLALMKALAADLDQRLASDDPFTVTRDDTFFLAPQVVAQAGPAPRSEADAEQDDQVQPSEVPSQATWEHAIVDAHTVLNQVGAVRARAVAHFARWGRDHSGPWSFRQHPLGHRDEAAADQLAPLLRLGTHEADRVVDESVWMTTRTPNLLRDTATGAANLATVATIAVELQDAHPATCERVETTLQTRRIHRITTRISARRSARTLVERFETAAARTTKERTAAQHTGVWVDPHPTPGLAALSAVMPTADIEALMAAVDERATRTHRTDPDQRLLGQHRAQALTDLALHNVTLTAHLDLITQPGDEAHTDSQTSRPSQTATSTGQSRSVAWEALRGAGIVLTTRLGAIPGDTLATVLAAHVGGRTDTLTTTLLGRQPAAPSNSYRPPKALREHVIRRDGHCRFPGCHRPARYTDLDHVHPWPHGPTDATNLQCLCRRHHQAKQHGWTVTMNPAGTCTWTTPHGQQHLTHPRLLTALADLTHP